MPEHFVEGEKFDMEHAFLLGGLGSLGTVSNRFVFVV